MNDPLTNPANKSSPAPTTDGHVPANLPLELLPVYDWWKANGSRLLTTAAIVAILVSGTLFYLRYHSNRKVEAAAATSTARSVDELEGAVASYGGTAAGTAAKLRLARAYCDAGRFEDALKAYDAFIESHASHPFIDTARVGRAQALEGLNRTAEALAIYREFRVSNPAHYLAPTACMGEARCLAMQGKKDEAKSLLDDLRAAKAGTPWEPMAKQLQGVIERYDGRTLSPRSLFDQAALMSAIEAPAASNAPAVP